MVIYFVIFVIVLVSFRFTGTIRNNRFGSVEKYWLSLRVNFVLPFFQGIRFNGGLLYLEDIVFHCL